MKQKINNKKIQIIINNYKIKLKLKMFNQYNKKIKFNYLNNNQNKIKNNIKNYKCNFNL